jgi:hypothetical protein
VIAHAVRVIVATVGITVAGEAFLRIGTTTALANAILTNMVDVLANLATVRSQSKGVGIGLPDVDLTTASTELTDTSAVV